MELLYISSNFVETEIRKQYKIKTVTDAKVYYLRFVYFMYLSVITLFSIEKISLILFRERLPRASNSAEISRDRSFSFSFSRKHSVLVVDK